MRKLYPDNQQTQEIFNRDDNRATKQDIQDLSLQIAETNQTLQNTINALSTLSDSLAESLNTNEINAINASINMLEAASANLTSANIANLTVTELATLKQLTTDLATIAQDLTVGGDVSITGDISANDATFENLTATSATITNWTIDNLTTGNISATNVNVDNKTTTKDLEVENNATVQNLTAANANITAATFMRADAEKSVIDSLESDEIAIENIHWKAYQTYTGNDPKLFMVLPHFENGVYFVRAVNENQVTLFAVEVFNSIDNLFARWSQKEMNWVYKISKVGTGAATQCMLEIHNVDAAPFTLEFATICATENVPGPTTYTTQPFPGNPMYKVAYQDGNKFFQNVDLANEGTTGSGLTKYATSNHALATQYYNYDGTMGVMDYDYLPDQSLNKADDVEFYGLQVHDFETENLEVPGTYKGKHIYDGPQLTAAQKEALPDETLLIEEGQSSGFAEYAYAITKAVDADSLSKFYTDENGHTWKWANDFTQAATGQGLVPPLVPAGANVDYTNNSVTEQFKAEVYIDELMELGESRIVKSLETNATYVLFYTQLGIAAVSGAKLVPLNPSVFDYRLNSMKFESSYGTNLSIGDTTPGYFAVYDSNDELMVPSLFEQLGTGDTFKIAYDDPVDGETFVIVEPEIYVAKTEDVYYSTGSGGTTKLTRKTTKSGVVQVKPLIPFNDDATAATDDRPLVYDRDSDTIKKATGDLALPGDVAVTGDVSVGGDLSVTGDTEYTGDTTFNGDVTIGTAANPKTLTVHGDATVHDIEAHTITANDDVFVNNNMVVSGDLEVRGTTFSSEVENVQSDGDWMVLRANNPTGLANGDYAGIVFHKYNAQGKDASITVDNSGTFRLSTQTEESVSPLLNTWLVDEQYFTGNVDFSQATLFSENYPVTRYSEVFTDIEAYKDSSDNHYFYDPEAETIEYYDNVVYNTVTQKVELAGNVVSFTPDPSVDTPHEVHFYTSISFMEPQASDMEPILTRDEEADMTDKALLMWDGVDTKAKTIAMPTMNNQALTAQITSAEPGINARLVKLGSNYYTEYPSAPYTGTVPADATFTPEENFFDESSHYWYSPSQNKYYEENAEIISIYYDDILWNDETIEAELPSDVVEIPMPTTGSYYKAAVPASTTYQWKSNVGGGGLSFVGTRAQYETARLIPEGQDGYIGPNTLVTLTDEDEYLKGDNR